MNISSFFLVKSTRDSADKAEFWIQHSHDVILESERLLSHLKDAETGQRGFLITGKQEYLHPFDESIILSENSLQILKVLTIDNSVQIQRLKEIQSLINKKYAELTETIQLKKGGDNDKALTIVNSNHGKHTMDSIRQYISDFKKEEHRLLKIRKKDYQSKKRNINIWYFFTSIFLIFLLMLFGYLIYNTVVKPIVKLTDNTKLIAQRKKIEPILIYNKDEISQLIIEFENMYKELKVHTKNENDQRAQLEIMIQELGIAKEEIQSVNNELEIRIEQRTEELISTNKALVIEIEERKIVEEELRFLSSHDPLTGFLNRQHMEERLTEDIHRSQRYNHSLSVFMIDIDHFKKINDTYGHQTGDYILINTSSLIKETSRSTDYITRYGGEEFLVVLPETSITEAEIIAERLCKKIASKIFKISDSQEINVNISIGVTSYPEFCNSYNSLLLAADKALYEAKNSGRNQVKSFRG